MNKPVKLDFLDVVSVPKSKSPIDASTFKVMEVASCLAAKVYGLNSATWKEWSDTGVECEVLKMDGYGWQKGRVRISLEFIPDEEEQEEEILEANLEEESITPKLPESPLDDLRTKLKID
jgi:hypothetical protein